MVLTASAGRLGLWTVADRAACGIAVLSAVTGIWLLASWAAIYVLVN